MTTIYPEEATILASACAIIFCIVGVIGNFVTILALAKYPKLRTNATTAFIISLSVSDFLFCLINLPLTAARYVQRAWTLGDILCKLFPVIFYGNVTVSVLNMVAITINRYILISWNNLYQTFYTKCCIWAQLVSIWMISFLIMVPPLLGIWGQLGEDTATFSCTILEKDGSSPKTILFLVGFLLPCIIIVACYARIYCNVRKARKNVNLHNVVKESRSRKREQDDRRLTKLMLIIFITFLLSFMPLTIVNVFDKNNSTPFVHVIASILAWMSSVINPFIYAVSNRQYRDAYVKLLNRVKVTGSMVPGSNSRQNTNNTQSKIDSTKQRPSVSDFCNIE